jgi:long-chain acyl-CoA synthetase
MKLGEILEETSKRIKNDVALVFEGQKIKWGEFNTYVNRLSHALMELNVSVGDRVAIWMSNCPEYMYAYYANGRIGSVSVPVNTFLKGDEVAFILNDSATHTIFLTPDFYEEFQKAAPKIRTVKNVIINATEKEFNSIFRTRDPKFQYFQMQSFLKREPSTTTFRTFSEEDLGVLIYTSGTTGFPKGAMLTHKNIVSNANMCNEVLILTKKDRMLLFLPMFHSFTELVCMVLPVFLGLRIVILPKIDSSKIKKSLIKDRPTVFIGVPTVYNSMAQVKLSGLKRRLNPIRLYVSGAAPLAQDILNRFIHLYQRPLIEGYGLSEASPVVSCNLPGKERPLSVGLPVPGVEVKIVDENEREMKVDQVGEIIVRGSNVMKGYWKQPDETEKTLKNGWLFTGDMGKKDEDGYLYIVDRKKDMLLYRGQNIYPREIEEAIYNNPKVKECAVVGVKDAQKGEIPKAYISLKAGEKATEKEMRDYLKEKIANYKLPRYIKFLDELPKTPTGKILKKDLRELAQKDTVVGKDDGDN